MSEPERVAYEVDRMFDLIAEGRTREPVRNREPRPPSEENRPLWHALMLRDGGRCWICGFGGRFMVMDHLHPRSSFTVDDLWIADRSDNLRIACWDCNGEKSNQLIPFSKPLPVVSMCATEHGETYDGESRAAWCHTCQMTKSVPLWWPIWGMRGGEDDSVVQS